MGEPDRAPAQAPPVQAPAGPVVAPAAPGFGVLPLTATAVLSLQRTAGNVASTRLLQRVDADGTIKDPAELEKVRPVGSAVDAATRKKVMDGLAAAPRAKAVLDDIQKVRGDLSFAMKWSARGDYENGGEIWLDRTTNYAEWSSGMAHEIVHLLATISGKSANTQTQTRADYINTQM